jgi:hypothetical protein
MQEGSKLAVFVSALNGFARALALLGPWIVALALWPKAAAQNHAVIRTDVMKMAKASGAAAPALVASPQASKAAQTARITAKDVTQFLQDGSIKNAGLANSLTAKLNQAGDAQAAGDCSKAAHHYQVFIHRLQVQSGKGVDPDTAAIMIADAEYLIAQCP